MLYKILSPIRANNIRYEVGSEVELTDKQASAAGKAVEVIEDIVFQTEIDVTDINEIFDESVISDPEKQSEPVPSAKVEAKQKKPEIKKKK